MSHESVVFETPHYVLLDGNRRIGPKVKAFDGKMECSPIYGFSNKAMYDKFCLNSPMALTPFPLVKAYLREQDSEPDDGLKLVVIDAAGPCEPCLKAATVKAVLESQERRAPHVNSAYCLTFDQQANAYCVDEISD